MKIHKRHIRQTKASSISKTYKRRISAVKSSMISTPNVNFASSEGFVEAVSRIYNQEIEDIDRFEKFAQKYSIAK